MILLNLTIIFEEGITESKCDKDILMVSENNMNDLTKCINTTTGVLRKALLSRFDLLS